MKQVFFTVTLLFFVSGSALGDAHVASHVATDSGDCAMCAFHANPVAAPAESDPTPLPVSPQVLQFAARRPSLPSRTTCCNHQRAPPR